VVVFAVNLKSEPVDLLLGFDGFGATGRILQAEALADTLIAGQPDVINHWNTPERLKIVTVPSSQNKVSLPGLSATAIECDLK
jgi:hypothetical protein